MVITNSARIGEALDMLKAALEPFVVQSLAARYKGNWQDAVRRFFSTSQQRQSGKPDTLNWDAYMLLAVMWEVWNDCFVTLLSPAERSLVSELRDVRNRWAHQTPFSIDDTYRALDSVSRLMAAVGASAVPVERMKTEVLRIKLNEPKEPSSTAVISHAERPARSALPLCDWVYFATYAKWSGTITKEFAAKHRVIVRNIHNSVGQAIANVSHLKPGDRILLIHGGVGKPYQPLWKCTVSCAEVPVQTSRHCFDTFECIDESLDAELESGGYVRDPVVRRFTGISLKSTENLRDFDGTVDRPLGQTTLRPWSDVFRP